jgi:hypothetical protein
MANIFPTIVASINCLRSRHLANMANILCLPRGRACSRRMSKQATLPHIGARVRVNAETPAMLANPLRPKHKMLASTLATSWPCWPNRCAAGTSRKTAPTRKEGSAARSQPARQPPGYAPHTRKTLSKPRPCRLNRCGTATNWWPGTSGTCLPTRALQNLTRIVRAEHNREKGAEAPTLRRNATKILAEL